MEIQPPSGGCVLKLTILAVGRPLLGPAAFGRLCVETSRWGSIGQSIQQPPSGGCVLKQVIGYRYALQYIQLPSCSCVLKQQPLRKLAL